MATEKQVREAIKTEIATAAPLAVVVSRNVLDLKSNKWLNYLNSPADGNRLHGWFVTWEGGEGALPQLNDADDVFYAFGAYAYRTGTDASNSEDEWGPEVEAVRARLLNSVTAPAALRGLKAWSLKTYVSDEPGHNVHIAELRLTVALTVGCA